MQKLERAQRPLSIYAHPDDEVIGCSFAIHQLRNRIQVVYATDGMPSPIEDPEYYAPYTPYTHGDSYRSMRHEEARNALSILGMADASRTHFLDLPDSHLYEHVIDLIVSISRMIKEIKPDLIITGAYEGGHIDHDIVMATIWHCTQGKDLTICETPLYSMDTVGGIKHNLPTDRHRDWESYKTFSPRVSLAKQFAFRAYNSQRADLQYFSPHASEFYHFTDRGVASRGDFSSPPNGGKILYACKPGSLKFADFQAAFASSTSSRVKR